MVQLDNTTFSCHWADNCKYWASFGSTCKTESPEHQCYKGILNGLGGKRGTYCLVRALKCQQGHKIDWNSFMKCWNMQKQICDLFNKTVMDFFTTIQPHLVEIDCLSALNRLNPHMKRLSCDEWVIIEDYISGKRQNLMAANISVTHRELLEALSHFSYAAMHTDLVICNFHGVIQDNRCFLSPSTVHSKSQIYGKNDKGPQGIEMFFREHKCNDWCREFQRLPSPVRTR